MIGSIDERRRVEPIAADDQALRISYIADSPIPSGAANCVQVLSVVNALSTLGHSVELTVPRHPARTRSDGDFAEMCARFAVNPEFLLSYLPFVNVRGRLRGSYFWVAACHARARNPDLVITRNARIALACTRLGLPVILELHTRPNSRTVRGALERLTRTPELLRVVFISDRLRQLYSAEFSFPPHKQLVAHDAVDLSRFEPRLERAAARRSVQRESAGKIVVHAGSLYEGRGAEVLLEAVAGLDDVSVWFVGGQPGDIERVKRRANELDLGDRALFLGSCSVRDLPRFLFCADVLVIPSTLEGVTVDRKTVHVDYSSPMKLFEYLAAARPIVSTRLSGVAEVLSDGDNALLVQPSDATELRDAIHKVLSDESLAARLERSAAATARQHTWIERCRGILAELAVPSRSHRTAAWS